MNQNRSVAGLQRICHNATNGGSSSQQRKKSSYNRPHAANTHELFRGFYVCDSVLMAFSLFKGLSILRGLTRGDARALLRSVTKPGTHERILLHSTNKWECETPNSSNANRRDTIVPRVLQPSVAVPTHNRAFQRIFVRYAGIKSIGQQPSISHGNGDRMICIRLRTVSFFETPRISETRFACPPTMGRSLVLIVWHAEDQ